MRKSFRMTFRNAELWVSSFDGLGGDGELIRKRCEEDLEVVRRPSSPSLILLTFFGTVLSDDFAQLIAGGLAGVGPHVRKAAFCGLDRQGKGAVRKALKAQKNISFVAGLFDETEEAKEWLL